MLFNSFDFLIFLLLFFILYWFVTNNKLKLQNLLIVVSSFVFYGWWDWRFLFLLLFSASVDYFVGIALAKQDIEKKRKALLWISISVNLGLLGFFKYYNFFTESFVEAFTFFGYKISASSLKIVLPVGISFYTFQALSYSIDVYRRKLEPTRDAIAYFAFISFFPQLVAGPIERATHLLPQFYRARVFNYADASEGMRLILWGLFKKVVVADNCALVVNSIFNEYQTASGVELIFGAVLFAFQIYGDFSGYSDMARGLAKLFGFELMVNFRTPYFSRDIAEFWRRWHISLSTWFRDYLYFPIGGSLGNRWQNVRNVFVVFLVSGFWHGANWTFIIWGALNAIYFLPLLLTGKNRIHTNTVALHTHLPNLKELFQMTLTFALTCIAWVFFRSPTVTDSLAYLQGMITHDFFPDSFKFLGLNLRIILILFISLEWIGRISGNWLNEVEGKWYRYPVYMAICFMIIFWGSFGEENQFIYFQF